MCELQIFTFNAFQENTYLLFDETKECVIIDPGCADSYEQQELSDFISKNKLKPVKLLLTHCHIDHVLGNKFIHDTYRLLPEINELDLTVLQSLMQVAHLYGVNAEPSPDPIKYWNEGDEIKFGNTLLDVIFTPGHSPGSICFIEKNTKTVIGGDVLFYGSIGRTDLPGGDYQTLISSIKTKLFTLADDYTVYSGHGPKTTIGFERKHNPFLT
jgi:glyoxylase-like metal-dependent hydrolase (beta-lactamase superfamily II)